MGGDTPYLRGTAFCASGALADAQCSREDVAGVCVGMAGLDTAKDVQAASIIVKAWFPPQVSTWALLQEHLYLVSIKVWRVARQSLITCSLWWASGEQCQKYR